MLVKNKTKQSKTKQKHKTKYKQKQNKQIFFGDFPQNTILNSVWNSFPKM